MAEISITIPDELKTQAEASNIDVSKLLVQLVKRELVKQLILKRLNSKEEQELTAWSVELGRRAKKGSFKRLLSELPKKRREELLRAMPPEKRGEYE